MVCAMQLLLSLGLELTVKKITAFYLLSGKFPLLTALP